MQLRRALLALGLSLALAGCGSTVQVRPQAQSSDVEVGPAEAAATDSAAEAGLEAPGGGGGVVAAGPASVGRATTTTRARTATAVGAQGPGVTDTSIAIGIIYARNTAVTQAALGNTVATQGDLKGEADAVIKDINATGGAAGRKLVAVYHSYDATSGQTSDAIGQAACEALTVDNKVLVAAAAGTAQLRTCTAKVGTVSTSATLTGMTDRDFAASPLYYDVQALSMTRLGHNLVEELAGHGYFTGWDTARGAPGNAPVKVGILVPDTPAWDDVIASVVLPRLAAHGIRVAPADVQRWHFPESTGGNANAVAQIQSAVLRFRTDKVTHVLPMDVNSLAFFAQPAESQTYRPRYGVSSNSGAQVYAGALIPYAQLNGAMGLGWTPALDLPASMNQDNGPYAGPGRKRCLEVLGRANITFADPTAKAVALVVCDELYSIRDAINGIPRGMAINAPNFIRAVEAFGDRFPIAALPTAAFRPGKRYPVDFGYTYRFYPDCNCMHYEGGPHRLQ